MPGISVVTDSGCDLMPEVVRSKHIRVVPLTIRFGDQEYDGLSAKAFWDRIEIDEAEPKTAAPSPGAFERAFLEAAEADATAVICINMSSKMSATYQAATLAAEYAAFHLRLDARTG